MAGDVVNKKRISGTLTFENHDRLERVAKKTMIPKTCIIEKGVEMVLEYYERQLEILKEKDFD